MDLSCENHAGVTVIKCEDVRLDAAIAVQFKDKFRELTGGGIGRIVLDLSNVEFMDSSGLGAVVAVYKAVEKGRAFCLAGLSSAVMNVFRLTRLDTVLDIFPSVDTARASETGEPRADDQA